jgi:gliding motility-associated-like protein
MKTVNGIRLQLVQFLILFLITASASAQLKADFSATPATGCSPMVVSFKNISTGNPTGFRWDLGNGTSSSLQNPVATYFNPGSYTVKLIVTNSSGKDSLVRSNFIVVNQSPLPAFNASDTIGCFPLKVKFTDNSLAGSGTIASWQWDFGDGTLSTEQSPVHTYTNSGQFTVILKIINSNGCQQVITKPAHINILNGVKASFSYSSVSGCSTPAAITFTNKTTGTGAIKYAWDFGDGNKSTLANPSNTYQLTGSYSVKLIASTSFGCADTMVVPNAIVIGAVKAAFTNRDTVCAGTPASFVNTSVPNSFTGSTWSFGNGATSTSANPSNSFATHGVYNVKLVTNFGACKDSIVKQVAVVDKPTATFTAVNTTACKGPLTVTFVNTSTNAVAYNWDFGDNFVSSERNPTHTYNNPGIFSVTLVVTNAAGCSETIVKKDLVKIVPPKIERIQQLNVKGCIPLTVSPIATVSENTPGTKYFWEFGDGKTSTESLPTHVYTTPGNFKVKLTITTPAGCTDTLTIVDAVRAGIKPKAEFSAMPKEVCAYTPVNFSDASTNGTIHEWLWMFGDGGISTRQNPAYTYGDTGKFSVTLIASNFGCADTIVKTDFVNILPPIAKFDTAFLCSSPLTRNFINRSVSANNWAWAFGDGSTSKEQSPAHTYAATGTYKVSLKVSNGACEHTYERDVAVVSEQANLQISDTAGCVGIRLDLKAANVNTANISSYSWYFKGLAATAIRTTNNAINQLFDKSGTYPIALVITDILRCTDTLYAPFTVNIYGPKADFSSAGANTCYGNTINFDDRSTTDGIHQIKEWTWNVGEGPSQAFSTGAFSHDYAVPGDYNVSLRVKDSYGCTDSIRRNNFVSVTKPVAKFTASDSIICPTAPVTFVNKSEGVGASYRWDFGDGSTSTEVSPSHSFTKNGVFIVKMLMTDKNGCQDSASTTVKIFSAKALFAMSDSFSTCPPLVVNITNNSTNYASINWDFGDGGNSQLTNPSHIYTYPGNYTVKLTIKNNGGCMDELTKNVVIKGPTGTIDYSPKKVCNPGTVTYSIKAENSVKYIWDYNDGRTIISTNTTTKHTYKDAGTYVPKAIIEDAVGCRVAITGIDTINVFDVKASFTSDNKVACDSGLITFRDSTVTKDVITSYRWNFGDGTGSADANPKHFYSKTGNYNIKLVTKTLTGCIDSTVAEKFLKVVKSPQVKISGTLSGCEPAKIKLAGVFEKTDTAVVTWQWDFGNGNTAISSSPDSQLYKSAGTFPLKVRVENRDGCFDTVDTSVIIHPKPIVDAGVDTTICRFSPFTLRPTGADSYTWSGTTQLSCTNCTAPTVRPDSAAIYYVKGKTVFGCVAEDSVRIKVQQPFKISVSKNDTLCVGSAITLAAAGADKYKWTPSLYLSNANVADPTTKPDSSVTYRVIGSDSKGCFRDTANISIKVYPIPTVEITNGASINVQAGNTVKIIAKSSADVTSIRWNPGQWLSCTNCAEPVASPKDNIKYKVTATNEGKCSAIDDVTVNVLCGEANIFMPNTFSPNKDGANDVFYPRGKGVFTIKNLKIFNRWGECIFDKSGLSANNPSDGWDGTSKGAQMPSDVYVYVMEVLCTNSVVFPFKGNVTLLR